jgi:hypothetical protein
MAYTINGNIPCGTEACTGREHTPAGACNSVYDIILDAIKEVKGEITNIDSLAKEATLLAKVAELKEALNTIDFTSIEQAIQDVEDVTAREETLSQGVKDIIKAIKNIDFTDLENSISDVKEAVESIDLASIERNVNEVKQAVENIDLSPIESKVEKGVNTLSSKIDNIDLTPIENKVDEGVSTLSDKIDNIDLSAVENKVQDESAAIQNKLDNLNVEVDLSQVAKQGDDPEATNSKILEEVQKIPNLKNIYSARFEKNDDNMNTYTMILPIIAGVEGDTIIL